MAVFELIGDSTYRVEGELTKEDIDKINNFEVRTNLVLKSTKGLSSEMVSKIETNKVYFSILGGLDYYEKDKYDTKDYRERTHSNPKGLTKILQYFEHVESGMNPNWTDTQKCMYAYNALAVDIDYVEDLEQDILSDGVTERGLNGILYNQLTCAGMAKAFKEMMDRLGIECHYQNQRRVHAFNVVKLDGKYRGVDVTWDCTKSDSEKCSFRNFGTDQNFYEKHGHKISGDDQERMFELTTFTEQEIQENYEVIEPAISARRRVLLPFRNFDRDRKIKFLPVDTYMEELEEEKIAIMKLRLLSQFEIVPKEVRELADAVKARYGFTTDYIGTNGDNFSDLRSFEKIKNDLGLACDESLVFRGGKILLLTYGDQINGVPISQERQINMTPVLLQDIKKYYEKYYLVDSARIDYLTEMYSMVKSMPPELADYTGTLESHLYSKLELFSNSGEFFKKLGIPEEEVDRVSNKAKECLESNIEETYDDAKFKHERDLDFLYAIVQDDVINTVMSGKEYSEGNLTELMDRVNANWKDAEFSYDEFRTLLDEVLDKRETQEEVTGKTGKSVTPQDAKDNLKYTEGKNKNDFFESIRVSYDETIANIINYEQENGGKTENKNKSIESKNIKK